MAAQATSTKISRALEGDRRPRAVGFAVLIGSSVTEVLMTFPARRMKGLLQYHPARRRNASSFCLSRYEPA
jgi:hypothetical protein